MPIISSNVILCDWPSTKNIIQCEFENGYDECKVRHDEEFSNADNERLEKGLNSSFELKQIMGDLSKEKLNQSVNLFHTRSKMIDKVGSLAMMVGVVLM